MKQRRWLAVFASLVALALVGAACSDDSSTPGDTRGRVGARSTVRRSSSVASRWLRMHPLNVGTLMAISQAPTRPSGWTASTASSSPPTIGAMRPSTRRSDRSPVTTSQFTHEDDLCSAEGGQSGATSLAADETIAWASSGRAARVPRWGSRTRYCAKKGCRCSPLQHEPGAHAGGRAPALLRPDGAQRPDSGRDRG